MKSIKTKKYKKFKLFSKDINQINKTPIKKSININISNNKINKIKNKDNVLVINNRGFNLIILFLILSVFQFNCRKFFLYKDSVISLKVSKNGEQKIFNSGTRPDEIWIDNSKITNTTSNIYNLNTTNIVQLKWINEISDCKGLFKDCISIVEINITQFNASKCSIIHNMFKNCQSLKSIDLSGFISPVIPNDMANMFLNCKSLTSLNLSSFDTSKTSNFGHLFTNCESLKWLDISNFKTENVKFMDNLFNGCKSLTSLNLSNFITSKVTNMEYMFNGCESLEIIDFPNLDISRVANDGNLINIFFNCNNLEYINIKNLISPENKIKNGFFDGTQNNLIICIDNDKEHLINKAIISNCTIINCLEVFTNHSYKINTENGCFVEDCLLTNYKYEYNYMCYQKCINRTYNNNYTCENCHSDCEECYGKYTDNNTNCISCISKEKYLNYGNCINNCSRGFYINKTNNQRTCKCKIEQCLTCSMESLNRSLCTLCDEESGFYPIYDLNNEYYPYLNCSTLLEGYYFDYENLTFKLCYLTCKSCNISGNETEHNCIECKNGYNYEQNFELYKNCYHNCSYYYYFDENNNKSICTHNYECPNNYDKLIENKRECVFKCSKDQIYKYEFQKKCFSECPENSMERENKKELELFSLDENYFCKPICNKTFPYEIIHTQICVTKCNIESIVNHSCIVNYQEKQETNNFDIFDNLINDIEELLTSEDYNTSEIENGNNEVIKYEHMTVTLTTTKNEKNDENNINVTTINLGDCEKILKEIYNISNNKALFMKKIEVHQEGMMIPKIEYDVYYKLNSTKLIKLNLSYCSNAKIDISIPVKINEKDIDKYNSSSGYYNDICYVTTSDSGTDIILKDRKNEFIDNNKTLCQENCYLSEYNNNKVKCSCDVKESSSMFRNIKIDKAKLYENFIDIKNIANINILICFKVLFSKNGLIKNYGTYSLMIIIVIHFIIIIIFYLAKIYKKIQEKINEITLIIDRLKFLNILKKEEKSQEKLMINNCGKTLAKQRIKNKIKLKIKFKLFKKNKANLITNAKDNSQIKKATKNFKKQFKDILESNILFKETITFSKKSIDFKIEKALKQVKTTMNYNDEELNDLEYGSALKIDKRKYCAYYYSLLKTKHPIFFTFFNDNDYNLKIVKIDLFLFNFSLFYIINALFFNDDTMHEIYKNEGDFDIIGQLPQILYSSFISMLFGFILEMLALTEGEILEIKKLRLKKHFDKKVQDLNKKIKIKLLLYFILSTIFLLFFWYYISMFCAIYLNTQIHLIKDTLLSYASSFIEPFGIYLIPGLFRIPALSNRKKKNRYILYKISKILQMILI